MIEETFRYRWAYAAALLVGGIGAFGQAALLRHELVNCYPYKVMSFPSGGFYAGIGNAGFLVAPVLAVVASSLLRPRRLWLVPALPVVSGPLFFWCVYKAAFLLRGLRGGVEVGGNFDGTSPATVEQGFTYYALSLSLTGLGVGLACGAVLWLAFRSKRRA